MKQNKIILVVIIGIILLLATIVIPLTIHRTKQKNEPKYTWVAAAVPESVKLEDCDKPCGTGFVLRSVVCKDTKGNIVDDSKCDSSKEPSRFLPCNTDPCKWEKTTTKTCPDCGVNETMTYNISCPVEGKCEGDRPSDTEKCDISPCQWYQNDKNILGDWVRETEKDKPNTTKLHFYKTDKGFLKVKSIDNATMIMEDNYLDIKNWVDGKQLIVFKGSVIGELQYKFKSYLNNKLTLNVSMPKQGLPDQEVVYVKL